MWRGWRRAIDWFDWIDPSAWHEEHNIQHHYRLNEEADPDLVERNLAWLRESDLPRPLKLALVPVLAATWSTRKKTGYSPYITLNRRVATKDAVSTHVAGRVKAVVSHAAAERTYSLFILSEDDSTGTYEIELVNGGDST